MSNCLCSFGSPYNCGVWWLALGDKNSYRCLFAFCKSGLKLISKLFNFVCICSCGYFRVFLYVLESERSVMHC